MGLTILKLGWEFPPYNYGGLGVACEGLVQGLLGLNTRIILILPKAQTQSSEQFQIFATDQFNFKNIQINALIRPYIYPKEYKKVYHDSLYKSLYGENIFEEIERYAYIASQIASQENFDIIHAHDWMTLKAGVAIKKLTGKPLIIHIHATEFDRNANLGVNQGIYDIERWGMHQANHIIAVSNFTKNKIVQHYGISPDKISVVHNAILSKQGNPHHMPKHGPVVLFLGRLTVQKGPDHFITAAQKVLEYRPDVTFIIAGKGYMESDLINRVAAAGLSDKILFTGLLRGDDVDRAYQMADVFVMPSVSEPFGLTALEAMKNNVPVIISKQSGVSEIINHCLKVDFWDINEMVNKIISLIDYKELNSALAHNGNAEIQKFSWSDAAQKCITLYNKMVKKNA